MMNAVMHDQVVGVLQALLHYNLSVSAFVNCLLDTKHDFSRFAINDLAANFQSVLASSITHPHLKDSIVLWVSHLSTEQLRKSVAQLSKQQHGWHFSVTNILAEQLENFHLKDMANDMERLAPELWKLLDVLLSAYQKQHLSTLIPPTAVAANDNIGDNEEEQYWAEVDGVEQSSGDIDIDIRTLHRAVLVKIVGSHNVFSYSILNQYPARMFSTEEGCYYLHPHTQHKPEVQCICECDGHLPILMQYT